MERMSGCLLRWKCLVACLFFDESQQPTWPHSRHKRRWTHVSPVLMHSSQTCVSVELHLICFRWLQFWAMASPCGRASGGLLGSFQCSAVPLRQGRTGFIGALQKFQYRGSRRPCAARVFMHQQKFAQLLMIKRCRRTHFLLAKALRSRRGIAIERGIFHVATSRPPARADHLMRIGFLHDSAQNRIGIIALRRGTPGKTCDRQIKASPEEMYRTGFADKARTKNFEHVVRRNQRAPEAARIFFVVRRVSLV